MERILNSEEIAQHRAALEAAVSAGSHKVNGIHVIQMWLGGNWMLRRDGKVIPEMGPVPDFIKEKQCNAMYETPGKHPVLAHEAYGHRLLSETKGAVCPSEKVESLIHDELSKMHNNMVNRVPDLEIEKRQREREAQIRAKNPAGVAWDADEAPAKAPEEPKAAKRRA